MERKDEELVKALGKIIETHEDEINEALETVSENIVQKGIPPKDALHMSKGKIESMYAQAFQLYNSGNYVKSGRLFLLLIALDGNDPRFMMGEAACYHMLKDYQRALNFYQGAMTVDLEDPLPPYHASDCALQMKDPLTALMFLQVAIDRAKDKKEYAFVKDRATLMRDQIVAERNGQGKSETSK